MVRGLIGSEKAAFFADPDVQAVFARSQVRVEVTAVGSRQMAAIADSGNQAGQSYDFVFPGGAATLDSIKGIKSRRELFTSPIAVATSQPIVNALAKLAVVTEKDGFYRLEMGRYLNLVESEARWDKLKIKGNPLAARLNVLVTTTDPRDTNSASLFAGLAANVVKNDPKGRPIDSADVTAVKDRVAPIFLRQGALDSRTEKTFDDYRDGSQSMQPPLVLIYEAQFLGLPRAELNTLREPTLLYLSPTILSQHTLGVVTESGKKLGQLLAENKELRRLATAHGFRDAEGRMGPGQPQSLLPMPRSLPTASLPTVDEPKPNVLAKLAGAVAK